MKIVQMSPTFKKLTGLKSRLAGDWRVRFVNRKRHAVARQIRTSLGAGGVTVVPKRDVAMIAMRYAKDAKIPRALLCDLVPNVVRTVSQSDVAIGKEFVIFPTADRGKIEVKIRDSVQEIIAKMRSQTNGHESD